MSASTNLCECHGEELSWSKDRRMIGGGYWRCRVKERERSRIYRVSHLEQVRETGRKWAREHPAPKEAQAKYRDSHREVLRERRREYRRQYPERAKEQRRQQYLRNRDAEIERSRRWQAENPERDRDNERRWRAANPERTRAAINQAWNRRRARIASVPSDGWTRVDVWERDDGHCYLCGKALDPSNWHADHVIPLAIGGHNTAANVRAACPECNLRKGTRVA